MVALQSCCFCLSVRKGSYVSAIYTAAYFGVIVAVFSMFVDEERRYHLGEWEGREEAGDDEAGVNRGEGEEEDEGSGEALTMSKNRTTVDPRRPMTQSFLEPGGISMTTMYFNVVVLACASCGFFASLLLCYGLYVDNRFLLIPWILIVVVTTLVDMLHVVLLIDLDSTTYDGQKLLVVSIVFIIDFFLISMNIYCLLCVVSQYQEYKAGRGTAQHEASTARLPVIHYEAPRGPTSFLSSRKTTLPPPSGIISSSHPMPILLTAGREGRPQITSSAAGGAIAGDIEALGAKVELGGEGLSPSEGRITFISVPGGEVLGVGDEGSSGTGVEGWAKKTRRPPKRVQFPIEESCLEAPVAAEEGEEVVHDGPFISDGGHQLSVDDSVSKSATLFLSSSSVTAVAAVVVANDTAPLLSPNPPLPSCNFSAATAFFSSGRGQP